jgi:hypothetical protein
MGCGASSTQRDGNDTMSPPAHTSTPHISKATPEEAPTVTETVVVEDLCESPPDPIDSERDTLKNSVPQAPPLPTNEGVDGPWRLPPPPANRFVAVLQRQVLPAQKFAAAGQRRSVTNAISTGAKVSSTVKRGSSRGSVTNPLSIEVAADGSGSVAGSSVTTEVMGSPRRLSQSGADSN